MVLRAEAFAKTNRSLRIVGKRPDGFHELDTVFQSIDLTDDLEVAEGDEIELECDDPALPNGPENLVHRAATRLAEAHGIRRGARIRLTKRIPAGAGLGGGSSDAAIALVLLARLWELEVSVGSLSAIARGLGSDVPFFLVGGTARGTGRGEILTALPDDREHRLVLVVPPFPISTAAVYARWSRPSAQTRGSRSYFGENDLASAVLETNPEMLHYMKIVANSFPDCQISGSGSSIVGLASEDSDSDLESVGKQLPGARVYLLRTVSRPEYRRRSKLDALD
jgi:4-diphosphocytidyl-2-C-methyl-D-erythritol kinase